MRAEKWDRDRARFVERDEASLEALGVRAPALRCHVCNVRLPAGAERCPHCGVNVPPEGAKGDGDANTNRRGEG
jgi:rRNA maturation endonuclease Nob1